VRFRDNLLIENTIPLASHHRHVAPLSVQTLVENALKHNVISREHPLALRLESAGPDAIRVANPVRPKSLLAPGTRVGLRNLVSRYALLSTQPIEITTANGEFSVSLPLL
jgi:LytS/YehU family sensor histidine kinase